MSPSPELHITVSKTFRAGPDAGDSGTRGEHNDASELVIQNGYRAVYGNAECSMTEWEDTADVEVVIGQRMHRFNDGGGWNTALDSEVESIPVGFQSFRAASLMVGIEVTCRRTDRALEKWQTETHTALLEAYQRQRQKYEEQLAALQVQAGVEITGRHPAANRALEKDELKKASISILTDQHYVLFDSIEAGNNGLPQLDLDEVAAEGRYIRFFEQAFEWENMTYTYYGYFWGRKSEWVRRLHFEDADPMFQAFLKAGAARVVLPVRPGFEAAIDHFMNTGEVWNGGELPDVTSALYVPIVQEIRERTGRRVRSSSTASLGISSCRRHSCICARARRCHAGSEMRTGSGSRHRRWEEIWASSSGLVTTMTRMATRTIMATTTDTITREHTARLRAQSAGLN